MAELGNKELSGRGLEAARAVHQSRGPGFLESVHESASCVELEARGLSFERQKSIEGHHRPVEVGEHRLDVLVEGCLWAGLKARKPVEDIFFSIGRSQMKAAGIRDGLILNFGSMPLTIKRIGPGLTT